MEEQESLINPSVLGKPKLSKYGVHVQSSFKVQSRHRSWDTSQVTRMSGMFYSNPDFNGDISKWDVSKVTNFQEMFRYAVSFNQDITSWDYSGRYSTYYSRNMLNGATKFHERFDCGSSNPTDSSVHRKRVGSIAPSDCSASPPPSPPPAQPSPPPPSPPPFDPVTATTSYNFQTLVSQCLEDDPVYGMCHTSIWANASVGRFRSDEYERCF